MELYEHLPLPVKLGDHLVVVRSTKRFIAMDRLRTTFVELAAEELQACNAYGHDYLCEAAFVRHRDGSSGCLSALFLREGAAAQQSCSRSEQVNEDKMYRLNSSAVFVFFQAPTTVSVACPERAEAVELQGFGLLALADKCVATAPRFQFVASVPRLPRWEVTINVPTPDYKDEDWLLADEQQLIQLGNFSSTVEAAEELLRAARAARDQWTGEGSAGHLWWTVVASVVAGAAIVLAAGSAFFLYRLQAAAVAAVVNTSSADVEVATSLVPVNGMLHGRDLLATPIPWTPVVRYRRRLNFSVPDTLDVRSPRVDRTPIEFFTPPNGDSMMCEALPPAYQNKIIEARAAMIEVTGFAELIHEDPRPYAEGGPLSENGITRAAVALLERRKAAGISTPLLATLEETTEDVDPEDDVAFVLN
jgi:hypothetical protein